MSVNHQKAPFPWFGGKSKAAPVVWDALGDPDHYVEPFAGSIAVLLGRPERHVNRPYHSETVNDADGLLVNAWRAIQLHPDATAGHASNPVAEADLHARHCALVAWREERELEHLMGDPEWCDPRMAGWWLWGICSWIGSGWCHGANGPWWPDETGRLAKTDRRGVTRRLPHVSDDGQGVNRAALREPGVTRQLPHLASNGMGVNRPVLREPGVDHDDSEFHPVTMPELVAWFRWLSARLRHVRVLNGDWKRSVTTGASHTLPVRQGGTAGFFLDPPYAASADRDPDLYAVDDLDVAHLAADWAIANGDNPTNRIVFAGFDAEHADRFTSAGWSETEWFTAGHLTGGMANTGTKGHQQARERLWISPHCLTADTDNQLDLFAGGGTA